MGPSVDTTYLNKNYSVRDNIVYNWRYFLSI
jgi:hypothetical protein